MRPGAIIEVEGIPNVWESEYKGKKQKNISYAAFEWQVVDMHGVDENVKTKIGEVHSMVSKASPLDESLDEIPF
jgi:D-mannonate dehydratase